MNKIRIDGNEYMRNTRGELVPVENIKPVNMLRDEVVNGIAEKALNLSDAISAFKNFAMEEADTFCQVSYENYGEKVGGQKGNITLTTYDGVYKVTIEMHDFIGFDERLQVAKQLVDKCLLDWSANAKAHLRTVVNSAFRVDKKGNVDKNRILELRTYEIDDPDWNKAMEAISDSMTVSYSRRYLRVYKRDDNGKYSQILLDFSAV